MVRIPVGGVVSTGSACVLVVRRVSVLPAGVLGAEVVLLYGLGAVVTAWGFGLVSVCMVAASVGLVAPVEGP